MPWDPDRYQQFTAERAAPFEDLVRLIEMREGMRVVDLGCGTGELTHRLAEMLPGSDVTGIDSSAEMLSRAETPAQPGLQFVQGNIETMAGSWDLVFSHAAIHWIDDHQHLVPRLLSLVSPGGQLAVQLPSNHTHPSHRLIGEIAGEEPFRTALGGWTRTSPALSIGQYAEVLYASGGREITVFEKVYPHVLEDADAVASWTSGTTLVPYFERLSLPLQDRFMEIYRVRLRELWPSKPVFYGFKRILFTAMRSA